MPVIEHSADPTLAAMVRVVAEVEQGRLSLDDAEEMMAYLRTSPHNPPRTYEDALAERLRAQRPITGGM